MPEDKDQQQPDPLVEKIEKINPPVDNVQIAALISQYTERPDLFLETMEKHDPGFIKRINKNAEGHSKKLEKSQFNFGRVQAYSTLFIQVAAALWLLYTFNAVVTSSAGFLSLLAIIIFFAISQSGLDSFIEIAKGVGRLIERIKSK